MRLRSRSYFNHVSDDLHRTKKSNRHSLRTFKTPNIRNRLRSFNGNRTVNSSTPSKKRVDVDGWSVSSNANSDLENRENFNESHSSSHPNEPVLTPIFSPRRFRSVNKDQAAKIKRVNARKIEFDVKEVFEHSKTNSIGSADESVLVSCDISYFIIFDGII